VLHHPGNSEDNACRLARSTKERIKKRRKGDGGIKPHAQMTRNLKGSGLEEGASTRLLVNAAKLIANGVNPVVACRSCIAEALTDDAVMLTAVHELSASVF
jgi:nitric oxide reductase NorQ protein